MIKALLTPVILGLAVAMVIRVAMARRAWTTRPNDTGPSWPAIAAHRYSPDD